MDKPVFVAGLGVVSAIGNNVAETLDSFRRSEDGIGTMEYLSSIHKNTLPVAEVKLTNDVLAHKTDMPPTTSRTAMLSMLASREALDDAGLGDLSRWRTGFVSANTVGGMDKTEDFFVDFRKDMHAGHLRNVVQHECGTVTELVANRLGINRFVTTISTACSSSANAIFFGARLIKNNILDVVIAGGADALTRFTLNGFNTLMILDPSPCKPFDENRKGLNLGEGAGYIVMVSERVARHAGKLYCRLSGYANANDAYHQTASSAEGIGSFMAMQGALRKSGLQPSAIDYINLHGTGTPNNDIAEGTAIKKLFAPSFPKMSSTKSFTGHTLGASGGMEAVFSCLSVYNGLVYPNLHWETPMADLPFTPETRFLQQQKIKHVLSNSFGFGGNCSSLIFSTVAA